MKMKIKDLPKIERPREKLEKYGPERLSSSELLAILLGTGSKGVNVVELSNKILKKFSGDGLCKANVKELKNTFGLEIISVNLLTGLILFDKIAIWLN